MRAGNAYANVHSTKWPGGEIRAQLEKGRGGNHHNGKGKSTRRRLAPSRGSILGALVRLGSSRSPKTDLARPA